MGTVLLGLALAVGAPAPKDRPKEVPSLVGEWAVETIGTPGRTTTKPGLVYTFTAGGRVRYHRDGIEVFLNRGYTANPRADPPAVDLIPDTAAANPRREYGIFKVEGDRLTIVVAEGAGPRPDGFDLPDDAPVVRYTFTRVKRKD